MGIVEDDWEDAVVLSDGFSTKALSSLKGSFLKSNGGSNSVFV